MVIPKSLFVIIASIVMAQGLFFTLVINKKNFLDKKLKLYFTLFLISIVYSMSNYVRDYSDLVNFLPHLVYSEVPIRFLILPFFYLYSYRIINRDLKENAAVHFIPSALAFISLIPFYILTKEEKFIYFSKISQIIDWRLDILFFSNLIQMYYYIYIIKKLVKGVKNKEGHRITEEKIKWINNIIYALFIYVTLSLITGIGIVTHSYSSIHFLVILLAISVVVFIISFNSSTIPESIWIEPINSSGNNKYVKSNLPSEKAEFILKKLDCLIENNKEYLDPDISIDKLAEMLNVSRHHLSEVLNTYKKKNYYDYINYYRVREAKKLLTGTDKNIIDIAMETGYKTKQTFNSVFKKNTKLTPSEFRKRHKNSNNLADFPPITQLTT